MDPITAKLMAAAAGGAAAEPVYVDDVFATHVYVGNGSTSHTITNGIDLAGEGGLVWIKGRSVSESHRLQDTVNGITKSFNTDTSNAETTDTQRVKSVSSTGFVLGDSGSVNDSGQHYCSWTFRKCPGFFDIVSYTGNSTSGRTLSHNLGSTPGFILVKRLDVGSARPTGWHRYVGDNKRIFFDLTQAPDDGSNHIKTASSTTFTLGADYDTNANGGTYIAYLFAHNDQSFGDNSDEAIIKCDGYSGNGGSQSINVGFEPQYVLIFRTNGTGRRKIYDVARKLTLKGTNEGAWLATNENSTEAANLARIHITTTGFEFDSEGSTDVNASGSTYAYVAIRRSHKPPTDATKVFHPAKTSSNQQIDTGFPLDLCIAHYTGGGAPYWLNRHSALFTMGTASHLSQFYLNSASSSAEGNDGGTLGVKDFQSDNFEHSLGNFEQSTLSFRRAKTFFEIVGYDGTGSAMTVAHGLGAVPELYFVKRRNASAEWRGYSSVTGATKHLQLNSSAAETTSTSWNDTAPTSSVFSLGSGIGTVNSSSYRYIAFLFATVAGVSKVGSYTGTGSAINVDCGFSAGARFVLIKRTDSTGDWFYWTSSLGIVSGNDPYLRLNSTGSKVTSNDYIDPLNAGFTVTSSAPAALNASSGTYLFLAIA